MYPAERLDDTEVLVETHMDLVKRIAHHLTGRLPAMVAVQDLIQAGAMGLLEAARQYDSRHGASFETYAGIRIRGAMLDEARRLAWAPRSTHRAMREISRAIHAVEQRIGRTPAAADIAAELEVDLETYHAMVGRVAESSVFNLQDFLNVDGDGADALPGDAEDPAKEYLRESLEKAVVSAIKALPERERLVMSMYYDQELNLREIGEVLGVTESRVCQIHGQALARLRTKLARWESSSAAD